MVGAIPLPLLVVALLIAGFGVAVLVATGGAEEEQEAAGLSAAEAQRQGEALLQSCVDEESCEAALERLEALLDDEAARGQRARLVFYRGALYEALNRTDEALADYLFAGDRLGEFGPDIAARLLLQRSAIYAQRGEWSEAKADLDRLLESYADQGAAALTVQAYAARAGVALHLEPPRVEAAFADFEAALARREDIPAELAAQIYLQRGDLHAQQRNFGSARRPAACL